jgi:nucleotide-binding universal stress UspA family protein
MGTIFVAYGEAEHRTAVLEFAVEQAAASDHDLLVCHIQESSKESARAIREEIDLVVQRIAPDLPVEVRINTRDEMSDQTNISAQKRLVDAILEPDRDYEYVVMGDIERGSIEGLAHASLTEAVLKTHAIPVLLVPV